MVNRLQFVRKEGEPFSTREEAINYILNIQVDERPSLYGEPIVVRYGDRENPNVILCIGSVGEGHTSVKNKTFFIDIAGIDEKIEELEDEIAEIVDTFSLNALTSDTIELVVKKQDDGTVISGDVKTPDTVIINRHEVDNIIKTNQNGLYSYVNLTFDDDTNSFIFQVNDDTKEFSIPVIEEGRYELSTKKLVFTYTDGATIAVDVKDLARSWRTPDSNISYTYNEYLSANSLNDTSIILKRDEKTDEKDLLWGDVKIATSAYTKYNILERNENGGLFVDGRANNIKYMLKDGQYITVQEAIDNDTTKVSPDVKNIIYKKYDSRGDEEGLYASIEISYDDIDNILYFTKSTVNGREEHKAMKLNSTAFIDNITYDSTTETLRINYIDKDGTLKYVDIDLSEILNTWVVENDGHSVKLDKNTLTPGKDILSADVKVATKTNTNNNILEEEDHKLVVKGYAWNVKYTNEETVEQALNREKTDKIELDNKINALSGGVDTKINELSGAVDTKIDSLSGTVDNKIDSLSGAVDTKIETVSGNLDTKIDAVSGAIDAKIDAVSGAIESEVTRATNAENTLQEGLNNVQEELDDVQTNLDNIQAELDRTQLGAGLNTDGTYKTNLDANYINRATSLADADNKLDAQVKVNADAIDALSAEVNTNKVDVEDTTTVNMTLREVAGSKNVISSDVNIDTSNTDNIIITTENGLCATIIYNETNNTITLSNGTVIQLTRAINRIWYDHSTEEIVIEYVTASGIDTVRIPVGELIREWNVNPHNASGDTFSSGITLTLVSSKTSVDILSAAVNISTLHDDNILSIATDGGLYVPENEKVETIIEGAGLKESGEYSANTNSNYIKFATSLADADNKLDTQIKANKDAIDELSGEIVTNKVDVEDTPSVNMTLTEVQGGTNIIKSDVNISEKEGNIIILNESSSIKGIYASAELGYNESTHIITLTTSNGSSTVNLSGLSNEWIVSNENNNVTLEKTLDDNEYVLKANVNVAPTSTAQYADNILENVTLVTGKALYVSGSGITENKNNIETLSGSVNSIEERLTNDESTINEQLNLITANTQAIEAETTRATNAENALQSSIEAETTRATNAENALQTAIEAETERAINAENDVQSLVEAETERATNAENALQTAVDNEATRATNAENALQTAINNETTRATNAENALQTAINNETTRATSAETALQTAITNEITRAEGVENSLNNAITAETATRISEDTRIEGLITTEKNDRVSADTALNNAIITETANRTTSDNNLSSRIDNEVSARTASDESLRNLIAENTAALSSEVQRAIGAESAITESITTERTRAQGVENALSGAITSESATRASEISRLESEIASSSAATTINVGETNTITLTKDAQNLVLGNVRLDTNTNGNIITTHTDGLYANVNLEYSAATNTLYYTVNGVTTPIVLNAGSIIDDISYNPVEKTLVITYSTAAGETRTATVGVADLIDVVTVQSGNHSGGIQLTSYTGDNGETVISAGTVISSDANNILVNDNGVLKVIGTAENIVYGNETVASVLSGLTNGLNDEISQRQSDVSALSGAITSITASSESLTTEINNIETGAGLADDGTYSPSINTHYISGATSLKSADELLDSAVYTISGNVSTLSGEVVTLSSSTNDLKDEIDRIELGAGLTESGTYEPNLLANYISGATSLKTADELLDSAVKDVNDKLDDLSEGNPTYSTVISTNEDGNLEVNVKLSHSYNQQSEDIENVEVDNYSEITTDNLLRIIHVKDSIKEAKSNGLYFDGSIDYGEF